MILIDITYSAEGAANRTAVALGYFDGLHIGHTGVIGTALSRDEFSPAVFTFNCDSTLPKFRSPEDIISFDNKTELMERMGVEYICAPDFAEVCGLSDDAFVREILKNKLNAGFACCGRSFRFGKGGCGTPDRLIRLGKKYGIEVEIVPDICLDGQVISSTRIRELIRKGEIAGANRMLGYELWYKLPVIEGNHIGREISFPTINQLIPETNIVPRYGVYKSFTEVAGRHYRSITNIGIKPTIADRRDGSGAVMETHITGFDGELYGQKIAVSLVRFIRPEIKFSDLSELKKQIASDIKNAQGENKK